jgi:hypothetical protein
MSQAHIEAVWLEVFYAASSEPSLFGQAPLILAVCTYACMYIRTHVLQNCTEPSFRRHVSWLHVYMTVCVCVCVRVYVPSLFGQAPLVLAVCTYACMYIRTHVLQTRTEPSVSNCCSGATYLGCMHICMYVYVRMHVKNCTEPSFRRHLSWLDTHIHVHMYVRMG